tara:strand:+ start:107 stop:862 length:756 start_codon:yes stop_codon:yes gene_type:complete
MNNYELKVIDSFLPDAFRKEIQDYLLSLEWFYSPTQSHNNLYFFTPNRDGLNYPETRVQRMDMVTPRVPLASDEIVLKQNHPLIHKLWELINNKFDNNLEITGVPEGLFIDGHPKSNNNTLVPGLDPGWRVYASVRAPETIMTAFPIHKDTVDPTDESSRNILYNVNFEWYPSWHGDYIFYKDSDITGDHQQFIKKGQKRGFGTDWPAHIVGHKPGNVVCYDGRWLHSTRPTSYCALSRKISLVFRARIKK